jgi:outer membrane protein assembly factor BamD (BamD/ComL family)
MSEARVLTNLLCWLAIGLVGGGCASGLGKHRDTADGDNDKSLFHLDELSARMKKTGKQLIGKGENPEKARELYATAEGKYGEASAAEGSPRQKLFLAAAKGFKEAADRWPDSALEQDALFLAGESLFFADYYAKANTQYEALLKKFPNSRYLDVVEARRFSIAQYWLAWYDKHPRPLLVANLTDRRRAAFDDFGQAVRVYDRIRIDDPTGKLADDATLAAANAYFSARRFMDADNFYTDLRKTFPNSEHQFTAHFLGLKAKLESYQGSDYSGMALDEAEKLIQQIRRQFPQQAAQEQEFLTRAQAEVRYKKAEREWQMAHFHQRRSEYGAARFYYALVVKNFADTPFAPQASEQLVALRDKPDVPPQRFEWLVDAFPKEENNRPLIATGDAPKRR